MKILFLQHRLLFPTDSGGKIRTLNLLRHLARRHQITYLCNDTGSAEQDRQQMRNLGVRLETVPFRELQRNSWRFYRSLAGRLLSAWPITVSKDHNPALRARAQQLAASHDYDLVVCDFVQLAPCALPLALHPKILFQHNVEAQIFQRHAASDRGWLRRQVMKNQWRKMQRFEADAGAQFDTVIAVSEQDRLIFQQQYGWHHVQTIDTSVDTDYFQPQPGPVIDGRVVFVGALNWLPNEDGVQHFVHQIWPRIRRRHPQATFEVVGRHPSPAVQRLAEVPGVRVVGTVPDTRPYVAAAQVVIVPLLVGGGTRMKIFEAMAMERAVVSTTIGAEGLQVEHGRHLLLADSPAQFADAVTTLIASPAQRRTLAAAARQLVCRSFSAEAVAYQFEAICRQAVASHTRLSHERDRALVLGGAS